MLEVHPHKLQKLPTQRPRVSRREGPGCGQEPGITEHPHPEGEGNRGG